MSTVSLPIGSVPTGSGNGMGAGSPSTPLPVPYTVPPLLNNHMFVNQMMMNMHSMFPFGPPTDKQEVSEPAGPAYSRPIPKTGSGLQHGSECKAKANTGVGRRHSMSPRYTHAHYHSIYKLSGYQYSPRHFKVLWVGHWLSTLIAHVDCWYGAPVRQMQQSSMQFYRGNRNQLIDDTSRLGSSSALCHRCC
jgi:hypothetical protein